MEDVGLTRGYLMKKSHYSIREITYAVGFSNVRTFERVFKKLTHSTPSQLKKTIHPS